MSKSYQDCFNDLVAAQQACYERADSKNRAKLLIVHDAIMTAIPDEPLHPEDLMATWMNIAEHATLKISSQTGRI